MEWIILICALGIAAYLYYYKRPFFDKHKGFIEISLIIFTALFTIYQVRSSADDFNEIVDRMDSIITKAEESSKSLHNVDESLSKLPQQMDSLSNSIIAFNDVISEQREQLSSTLNGLNESIRTFKSDVDSMVERFSRKPKIRVDLSTWKDDTSRGIKTIAFVNEGTLLADITLFQMYLPTKYILEFNDKNFKKGPDYGEFSNYVFPFDPPVPLLADTTKVRKIDSIIILKNESFEIRFVVYYRASFGNDGSSENRFMFNKELSLPIRNK
jgi:hypothetical protein